MGKSVPSAENKRRQNQRAHANPGPLGDSADAGELAHVAILLDDGRVLYGVYVLPALGADARCVAGQVVAALAAMTGRNAAAICPP